MLDDSCLFRWRFYTDLDQAGDDADYDDDDDYEDDDGKCDVNYHRGIASNLVLRVLW